MCSIQVVLRHNRFYAAPMQGPVTLDIVACVESVLDIEAVAKALAATLAAVPASADGWERLDYSHSPFQKFEGIRRLSTFERGLRMLYLSTSEDGLTLERYTPYPGERHGYTRDESWTRRFPASTPLIKVAEVIAEVSKDMSWRTR